MTLSPERSGGRQYARQLTGAVYCVLATRRRPPRCLADVTEEALAVLLQLQSKSPMQHLDKFGVVEVPTVVRAKENARGEMPLAFCFGGRWGTRTLDLPHVRRAL